MNLYLILALAATASLATYIAGYWLAVRLAGLKATARGIALPILAVTATNGALTVLSLFVRSGARSILSLTALVLSLGAWHFILRRQYDVSTGKSFGSYFLGSFISGFFTLIIAIATLHFVQLYQITGRNLLPDLLPGDKVLVNKSIHRYKAGDVVVYTSKSGNTKTQSAGRIQSIPGQTIKPNTPATSTTTSQSYVLQDQEYYVADNAQKVQSGRIVPAKEIVGVVSYQFNKVR